MKKILLAEDDTFLLDIYQNKFAQSGFDVSIAENGEEAVQKIDEHDYDMVLLDVMMPKLNGFEVLRKIRNHINPKKSSIPVVMLTNLNQRSDIDQGLELGVSDYIIKSSLTPSEIVAKINSICQNQK